MSKVINVYALMEGIEKFILSGAVESLKRVEWHDKEDAFTDGDAIHLPRPDAYWNEEQVAIWQYKVEHELGHEDYVNSQPHWKEVMQAKKKLPEYEDDDTLWWISNVISDHVQERNRIGNMIGRDNTLKEGRKLFLENLIFTAKSNDGSDGAVRGLGMFYYDTRLRQEWNDKIVLPKVDAPVIAFADKIKGVLDNLKHVTNEGEVFEAALKLRPLWPESKGGKGKKNKGKGEGEGEDDDEGTGKGGKDIKDSDATFRAKAFTPGEHDPKAKHKRHTPVYTKGNYRPRKPTPIDKSRRGASRSMGEGHITEVRALVKRTNLPAKVRAYLMGLKRINWTSGYRSGKLDTNRLSDALRNKVDLFRRKEDIRVVDSAVYLLIDGSGSMSGRPFQQACASAIMLADALQGIGVNLEIASFTEHSDLEDGFIVETMCAFGQRYNREQVLRSMTKANGALANNPDGEAILWGYQRLKRQVEHRKVLIVLSDGDPAGQGPAGATASVAQYTRDVLEQIQKDKSVHVVGLGMSGHNPSHVGYKNAIACSAGDALERTLLEVVKTAIVK